MPLSMSWRGTGDQSHAPMIPVSIALASATMHFEEVKRHRHIGWIMCSVSSNDLGIVCPARSLNWPFSLSLELLNSKAVSYSSDSSSPFRVASNGAARRVGLW